MGVEIERKFLLKPGATLPESDEVLNIRQSYLAEEHDATIRLRVVNMEEAFITIKQASKSSLGVRKEYEYAVPVEDAIEMMNMAPYPMVVKQRHIIIIGENKWEVDFFMDDNEGLMLAEVELPSLDVSLTLPEWIGQEVTDDPRYLNASLAKNPYNTWNK